jgi:hypothetical protein
MAASWRDWGMKRVVMKDKKLLTQESQFSLVNFKSADHCRWIKSNSYFLLFSELVKITKKKDEGGLNFYR